MAFHRRACASLRELTRAYAAPLAFECASSAATAKPPWAAAWHPYCWRTEKPGAVALPPLAGGRNMPTASRPLIESLESRCVPAALLAVLGTDVADGPATAPAAPEPAPTEASQVQVALAAA